MDLKTRKLIKNGVYSFLPGFLYGNDPRYKNLETMTTPNPYLLNDYGFDINLDYQEPEKQEAQSPINMRGVLDLNIPSQNQQPITVDGITDNSGTWKTGIKKSKNSIMSKLPWVLMALWGAGGFLNGLNSTVSSDLLLQDAGKTTNSFGGISYNSQRSINKNEVMDQYDKKTVNSVFTNPLETVGRLINRGNQLDAIREAEKKRQRENNYNRSSAASKYMQLKEALGYALGKDTVETANGFAYGIEPNARGDYGEIIKNVITGAEHKIRSGKGKVDGALINIKPTDVILSERTGAADYYEDTGDLNGAIMMNKIMRQLKEHGKLPGLKFGWPNTNTIIHGIEGLAALGDYLGIKNEPVKRTNTYRRNEYENFGLRGLAGLHYNKIPILNLLTNMRASSDYALRNSGINGAQQYLGSIANTANMYKAIADLNTNLLEKNIALKSNFFNSALNTGSQNSQRNQQGTQFDDEFYAKGHGAKSKKESTRFSDIFNIGQSWLRNENALNLYSETIDLYRQKLRMEEDEIKNRANRPITNTIPSTKYVYVPQSYTTNENWYSKYFPNLNFTMQNKPWRILS